MPAITSDRLDSFLSSLRDFVRERDWAQFHDPKNLAMCLGSEVGELIAEYRWVPTSKADALSGEEPTRTRIACELGDIGIAWLLLCDRLGFDPIETMKAKLELNRAKYPLQLSRGRADAPKDSP